MKYKSWGHNNYHISSTYGEELSYRRLVYTVVDETKNTTTQRRMTPRRKQNDETKQTTTPRRKQYDETRKLDDTKRLRSRHQEKKTTTTRLSDATKSDYRFCPLSDAICNRGHLTVAIHNGLNRWVDEPMIGRK